MLLRGRRADAALLLATLTTEPRALLREVELAGEGACGALVTELEPNDMRALPMARGRPGWRPKPGASGGAEAALQKGRQGREKDSLWKRAGGRAGW